jgi:hypothetical protein
MVIYTCQGCVESSLGPSQPCLLTSAECYSTSPCDAVLEHMSTIHGHIVTAGTREESRGTITFLHTKVGKNCVIGTRGQVSAGW